MSASPTKSALSTSSGYLAEYNQKLKEAEDVVNNRANQMTRLKAEFDHNLVKLADSYFPRTWPLRIQVYQAQHYIRYLEKEIEWKKLVKERMEQCGGTFNDETQMTKERQNMFDKYATPKLQDALDSMANLLPQDLAVLRSYDHPPTIVVETFQSVAIVRDEKFVDWDEAKVMLADAYFFGFFLKRVRAYDLDAAPDDLLEKLEPFMLNPELEPGHIGPISPPCGALCKWVKAIFEHIKIRKITRPMSGFDRFRTQPQDVQEEIDKLLQQIDSRKYEIAGAEHKLEGLQAEHDKRRLELKHRYDKVLDPLQETFFEAHMHYTTVASTVQSP